MKKNRVCVRLDDRTMMYIKEVSQRNKVSTSVTLRALIERTLSEIITEEGYVKEHQEEGSKNNHQSDSS